MNKLEKTKILESYKKILKEDVFLVLIKNSGLKTFQSNLIRKELNLLSAKLLFIKNRLFKTACNNRFSLSIKSSGPLILVYGRDPVLLSKKIVTLSTAMPININMVFINGRGINKSMVEHMSMLPSMHEIRSKLINLFKSTHIRIITVVNGSSSKIFRLIIKNKLK